MVRRLMMVACAVALVGACGADRRSDDSHLVLVDHVLDEFPTSFFGYFPRVVEAHPGDEIRFEQAWTGEAHTITLGTLVQPLGERMRSLLLEDKPLTDFVDTSEFGLPSVFPKTESNTDIPLNQVASQPCYVTSGPLPEDVADCGKKQPSFDGTQSFYNSGYIPFEGRKSNEFTLPLASSIKPDDYFYYCVLHGAAMGGYVRVKPNGTDLHGSDGLDDADLVAATKAVKRARALAAKPSFRAPGSDVQAGAFSFEVPAGRRYPAVVNEFIPSTFKTKVNQRVTWSFAEGPGHTVSFDVPKYLPPILFGKNGAVDINPETLNPVAEGDAYDGTYFLSSGYVDSPDDPFTITFTKPGTYPYACLIHPAMIGKVVVEA